VVRRPWHFPNNSFWSVLTGTARTLRSFRTYRSCCSAVHRVGDAVRLIWTVYSASKKEFRESMGLITGRKPSGHWFFSINPSKPAIQWLEFIRWIIHLMCDSGIVMHILRDSRTPTISEGKSST
jgi:hypothetical protein